jgi:general secretion pathway protein A
MYEEFFGFTSRPFQLAPDARYFFGSRGHTQALAHLTYGLAQGEGFIVITGEIGAGKTTLIDHLMGTLQSQLYRAARVPTTQLAPGGLLRMVLSAFDLRQRSTDKAGMLRQFAEFFAESQAAGRRLLLVVDEVQNLPFASLEELRMLSNLATGTGAPLQTCLVGQPQFRDIIMSAKAEQLRQRIVTFYHLGTLQENEIRSYIEHRLRMASWTGQPSFDADSFSAIYRHTAGVPRRINLLCSRLLLQAYLNESDGITGEDVELVARESDIDHRPLSNGFAAAHDGQPETAGDLAEVIQRLGQLEQKLLLQETALKDTVNVLDRSGHLWR